MKKIYLTIGIIVVVLIVILLIFTNFKQEPKQTPSELVELIVSEEIEKISQEGICLNKYELEEELNSKFNDFTIDLFCEDSGFVEEEKIIKQIGERLDNELQEKQRFEFFFFPPSVTDTTKGGYYSTYGWEDGEILFVDY